MVAHLQTLQSLSGNSPVTKVENWHFEDLCSIPGFATDAAKTLFSVPRMKSILYKRSSTAKSFCPQNSEGDPARNQIWVCGGIAAVAFRMETGLRITRRQG